jgi:hypothetical protein
MQIVEQPSDRDCGGPGYRKRADQVVDADPDTPDTDVVAAPDEERAREGTPNPSDDYPWLLENPGG